MSGLAGAQPTPADTTLEQRLRAVEADAALSDAAYRQGRSVAAFCANCHGLNGNSTYPQTPNLAGQNAAYLVEQIQQFGSGKRRNEFMQGLIKAMKVDEKVGVALYFSLQQAKPQPVTNPALVERGKDYYTRLCVRCHGVQGRGDDKIARIASQQPSYLILSLKRYRDGSASRMNPLMADNTRNMTDNDMAAVAAYLASMP